MLTQGILSLGADTIEKVISAIQNFDQFSPDNEAHGEHDFGAVDVSRERIFWKIDYYDRHLEFGSPDPSDPAVTRRVLTVMLASEY